MGRVRRRSLDAGGVWKRRQGSDDGVGGRMAVEGYMTRRGLRGTRILM